VGQAKRKREAFRPHESHSMSEWQERAGETFRFCTRCCEEEVSRLTFRITGTLPYPCSMKSP
jgi:hypothetical protein